MKELTAISLGAGYGSVGLSLLLERGDLPGYAKPDVAVFADTCAEPPHVYQTLDWLEGQVSWPIIRCSFGDLENNTWRQIRKEPVPERHQKVGFMDIPAFGNTGGIIRRQCTYQYKIQPIKKVYREFAGVGPPTLRVIQYLGISIDEAGRMKDAREKYLVNTYPLVAHRVSRTDIVEMMRLDYPDAPVAVLVAIFAPFTR